MKSKMTTSITLLTTFVASSLMAQQLSILHSFPNIPNGTALSGGTNGDGTIYSLGTNGANFTVLHTFSGSDGMGPSGGLVLIGQTLYGTTSSGGEANWGTVFGIDTNGANFRVLHTFASILDGIFPGTTLSCRGNTLFGTTAVVAGWLCTRTIGDANRIGILHQRQKIVRYSSSAGLL